MSINVGWGFKTQDIFGILVLVDYYCWLLNYKNIYRLMSIARMIRERQWCHNVNYTNFLMGLGLENFCRKDALNVVRK